MVSPINDVQNTNFLQTTKFQLSFGRLPAIQYFCRDIFLPGLNLSDIPRNTPFVDLYVPGEKLQYDPLTVTFLVDEDLATWMSIHEWMRALTFPTDFKEYRDLDKLQPRMAVKPKPQYSDGILTILNSKNNPNIRVKFYDLFPLSLSGVMFSTTDSAENTPSADASFRYSYYDIEKIST